MEVAEKYILKDQGVNVKLIIKIRHQKLFLLKEVYGNENVSCTVF